jgi:radical SAM superfamily enzyme YgiQ (UPF0313 family)
VLLINPPFYVLWGRSVTFLPVGLLSIASVLNENGYETKVYDANPMRGNIVVKRRIKPRILPVIYKKNLYNPKFYIWKKIRKNIKKFFPDIIGINISTCAYDSALNIAKIAKEVDENVKVIVGGYHPTALPTETIKEPYFDVVVRGEGEITMLELVKALQHGYKLKNVRGITYLSNGKIVHTPQRNLVENLDSLPFPARDLLIDRKEVLPVALGSLMGSRGCSFACNFCSSRMMWGTRVRFRSPENIVDEIEEVCNTYGIREFTFCDDTFTLNRKWAIRICKLIRSRKLDILWYSHTRLDTVNREVLREMKLAGCDRIGVGVESGNQEILNAMGRNITLNEMRKGIKKIREMRFILSVYAMLGYPGETVKTIMDTEKFLKEINPDIFFLYIATPYPGTKLYELAKKENLLLHRNWSEYTTFHPVLKLNTISNEELMNHYYRLSSYRYERWRDFYRARLLNFRGVFKRMKEDIKSLKCFMADLEEIVRMIMNI